jgi:O-antigen/teichoic acid export membrane protein
VINNLLSKLKNSPLGGRMARNSMWMLLGQILRVVLQAAYFFLIARSLGVTEYGAFVAMVSLVAIVSPFSGLGAGNIIIMKVARNPAEFSESWGEALFLTFSTGALLTLGVMLVANFTLPRGIALTTVLLVAVSDLLGPRVSDLASMAFGAFEQFRWNAILQTASTGFRAVGAAFMFVAISHPTASQWVWFYAASSILMSIFALASVTVKLGWPSFKFTHIWQDMKDGVYFSISASAQTVYNDIDKTMLGRLSTLDATGIYGAAYRIIDVSCAPLRAITSTAYPAFFREGQKGLTATYEFAKKILHKAGLVSLASTVGLIVFAPVLPHILGKGFNHTVEALQWLALLPLLKSFHLFLGDALTGAGYQRVRASMQIAVAVFNVAINFWLIPAYSWRGAAWSSLASDGLLGILMFACIMILRRSSLDAIAKQPRLAQDQTQP